MKFKEGQGLFSHAHACRNFLSTSANSCELASLILTLLTVIPGEKNTDIESESAATCGNMVCNSINHATGTEF